MDVKLLGVVDGKLFQSLKNDMWQNWLENKYPIICTVMPWKIWNYRERLWLGFYWKVMTHFICYSSVRHQLGTLFRNLENQGNSDFSIFPIFLYLYQFFNYWNYWNFSIIGKIGNIQIPQTFMCNTNLYSLSLSLVTISLLVTGSLLVILLYW